MCELFGLSASHPLAGPAGFLLEKEPQPAWRSEHLAGLIDAVRSDLVIAHARKARHPPVNTLANTHPFLRQCCGRHWAFAHNGLVPEIVALVATEPLDGAAWTPFAPGELRIWRGGERLGRGG